MHHKKIYINADNNNHFNTFLELFIYYLNYSEMKYDENIEFRYKMLLFYSNINMLDTGNITSLNASRLWALTET